MLLRANRAVDARWLMRMVWPAGEAASAPANLRQYIAKARQALQQYSLDDVAQLRLAAPGYRLDIARDQLDLTLFQDLATLGRQALAAHDLPAARSHLARAVGLWQGELGESLPPSPELLTERAYWEELRLLASQSLLTARLGHGEYGEAAAELRRLTAEHPLREELSGMLMVALYRCHRRSDALEVFSRSPVGPGHRGSALSQDRTLEACTGRSSPMTRRWPAMHRSVVCL